MAKVKKMAFGGLSRRPATPPAAPMRPQAAPLRDLNPQASLAKPDPLAAARAAAFRSGANLNPQTSLAAGPLRQSSPRVAGPAAGAAPSSGGLLQALAKPTGLGAMPAGTSLSTPKPSSVLDSTVTNTPRQVSGAPLSSGLRTLGLLKKGGAVKSKPKKMASGGKVSSASKRADGIATKGKTKGRFI